MIILKGKHSACTVPHNYEFRCAIMNTNILTGFKTIKPESSITLLVTKKRLQSKLLKYLL